MAAEQTLQEANARADSLHRLLWLVIRQIGGKLTIRTPTLLTWSDDAKLRILQDISSGGITLVADIHKQPLVSREQDPEMEGYKARGRGQTCQPPEKYSMTGQMLWMEGWRIADSLNRQARVTTPPANSDT